MTVKKEYESPEFMPLQLTVADVLTNSVGGMDVGGDDPIGAF